MDKALIVASISLLALLFFAHRAGSSVEQIPSKPFIMQQKCSESPHENNVGECGLVTQQKHEKLSEIFMRKIKRKARLLYASNSYGMDQHQ